MVTYFPQRIEPVQKIGGDTANFPQASEPLRWWVVVNNRQMVRRAERMNAPLDEDSKVETGSGGICIAIEFGALDCGKDWSKTGRR
jgi:hypothetical protein